MTEKPIEQLWYTWSDVGIYGRNLGLQICAVSPGLFNLPSNFYRGISYYTNYSLPDDADPEITNGPISLALKNTPYGRLLVHKVYIGRDLYGRTGNFFTHMLLGLPESFTARDAIELWQSSLWQTHSVPGDEQRSTKLPHLFLEDLHRGVQDFHFNQVGGQLLSLIKAFLAPNRSQQHVLVTGDSQHIAMLIWGVTHSIPDTLLPADFTFSTYEYDTHNSSEMIVGTTVGSALFSHNSNSVSVAFTHEVQRYANAALDADIADFARYVVECLTLVPNGHHPQLAVLIEEAENNHIVDVETFITFFKKRVIYEQRGLLINEILARIESEDWATVARLRANFSSIYPPANNSEAWNILFQAALQGPGREHIIRDRATHQWLFDALIVARPEAIEELPVWLSGSWANLAAFLFLRLSQDWHLRAIEDMLLTRSWSDKISTELVATYEPSFLQVLQQFVIEPPREYSEAVLDFFSVEYWPSNTPLKENIIARLIDVREIIPETRHQLIALLRPAPTFTHNRSTLQMQSNPVHTSTSRQPDPYSTKGTQKDGFLNLLFSVFQLSKVVLSKRLRAILVPVIFVIILIGTNILTFCSATSTSNKQTYAIAVSTLSAQVTQTVQSSLHASGLDNGAILTYSLLPSKIKVNQKFTLYLIVQNTGMSTWSDTRGYHLTCTSQPGSLCQGGKPGGFMGDLVLPNHTYSLSMEMMAPSSADSYSVTLGLAHNGESFGKPKTITVVVKKQ